MLIYPFSQSVSLLTATKRKQTAKNLQGLVHNCTNCSCRLHGGYGLRCRQTGAPIFSAKIHEGGRSSDPGVLLGPGQCPRAAQSSVCNLGAHEHQGNGAGMGLAVCTCRNKTIPDGPSATVRALSNTRERSGCSSRSRKGLRVPPSMQKVIISAHSAHSSISRGALHCDSMGVWQGHSNEIQSWHSCPATLGCPHTSAPLAHRNARCDGEC